MRLDRYLCEALNLSRSQARQLVRQGRVELEGSGCRQPAQRVLRGAEVRLDGDLLRTPGPCYLMLHKPAGHVCANRDDQWPTVLDLIAPELRRGLHPAGRLDRDTTGLLLLSNDGAWTHRLSSPRHGCTKVYRARLAQPLVADAEQQLARGLQLQGEQTLTKPAQLERLEADEVRLTLTEGRYHQVKRMMAALGNRVLELHREAQAGLVLDADLAPGAYRPLRAEELELLPS